MLIYMLAVVTVAILAQGMMQLPPPKYKVTHHPKPGIDMQQLEDFFFLFFGCRIWDGWESSYGYDHVINQIMNTSINFCGYMLRDERELFLKLLSAFGKKGLCLDDNIVVVPFSKIGDVSDLSEILDILGLPHDNVADVVYIPQWDLFVALFTDGTIDPLYASTDLYERAEAVKFSDNIINFLNLVEDKDRFYDDLRG